MPVSVNGQLISLGGGGIGTWDPLTEPDKIAAGENTSPGAFFLLNKMTNIIDDIAYASYGTLIFYDPEKERWQVGAGDEKNLGVFDNIAALQAKYPVGQAGQYALLKSTNTVWYWSTTTSAWVNGGSNVPADVLKQTDIVINLGSTDTTKVASASLATLLDNLKVDKVTGYSLTQNDFTNTLKTKLDGIQAGAEVNVKANWTQTDNTQDDYIAGLPRDANQLPNFYIKSEVYSKTEADSLFIENSEKAQPLGVATLDAFGKVPVAQLNPAGVSYYPSQGNFPIPGFTNNIYLAIDTNIAYSWVTATNTYKEIGDATLLKTDDIVNTFDQTSTDKVASAGTIKVLYDTKVDKITGKQLSTEDYTTAEKTKLAGIQAGAKVNVKANWKETNDTLDSFIEDKPLIVDNLSSTSVEDVLSANQGNALDVKKIDKVPNYTDFLPKFNLDGSLVSSTKKTSDFEPANVDILKTTDIVDNLSGGDVGNTRQVLEASQGKALKDLIDTKEPVITPPSQEPSTRYWRGDKTWQILNQNAVGISNRLITNGNQEVILSSLPTPDDTSDQNNVRVRVANTTIASTKGSNLELQSGNGTDGSGDVVFYGSATPENAITVGANSGSSASSTTALSFSHTVTSVSDRLLIVQVVCSGGQQASSATFASTPLTLAERTQSTTLTIETWYLVNPAVQTAIVQVNFTNPVNNAVARAINLNGVDQTTPIGQKAEIFNNNQTTSASLSLSTTLGQIVVDLIGTYNVTATLSGGQTQIWSGSTPQQEKGQGSYEVAQTPTTAVSYTFANSSYAFHVIAINKVGGTTLGTITEFGRVTASGIESNGLILPSTAYTTAGTYILTQQSTTKHRVYNIGAYNINLPKATYLRTGMIYEFSNRGSGSLSIRTQDAVQIATCPPNYTILLELVDKTSGYNGTWEQSYVASSGSVEAYVTSQKGVANGIAPLNATGVIPAQYVPSVAFPIGAIMALQVSPASFGSWLLLDGSAVSRSTYSALFLNQLTNRGTVTISQANPAVVTLSSHGLTAGQKVVFTSTGTLPTGITANTSVYYVMSTNLTANTFQISATYAGTAIATTTAGSGTHTLYTTLYGYTLGNGSTSFGLPNYAGRTIIGSGNGGGLTTRIAGEAYGAETHTLTTDEIPTHDHANGVYNKLLRVTGANSAANLDSSPGEPDVVSTGALLSVGSGQAHNNMQPSVALPVFVYSGV